MTETKTPPNANKMAMSRALGAAFLNHQVEQLEKSVSSQSGNWRDRRTSPLNAPRTGLMTSTKSPNRKKGGDVQSSPKSKDNRTRNNSSPLRPSSEHTKEADIIIADASVLIHGLDNLKVWGRNGREEVVIVPLEALNTLDLLKKGSTSLAQRARAASRVLEAQVGANPRIRVQRDDAFVPWDQIGFTPSPAATEPDGKPSPEWVRRTICCARWEVDNAKAPTPKVVLAVCSGHTSLSPQANPQKLLADSLTPVPLPSPASVHANKHEPRSNGSLVAHWAARAGMQILDVKPTPSGGAAAPADEDHKRSIRGRRPLQSSPGDDRGMVERSPAVLAMMEVVSQPSKVVRVLARGEKLDPDP